MRVLVTQQGFLPDLSYIPKPTKCLIFNFPHLKLSNVTQESKLSTVKKDFKK